MNTGTDTPIYDAMVRGRDLHVPESNTRSKNMIRGQRLKDIRKVRARISDGLPT